MERNRFSLLCRIGLLSGAVAMPLAAPSADGFYAGILGGANFLKKQNYKIYGYEPPLIIGITPPADGETISRVGFDTGYIGGLTAGYAFGALRPELELAYRSNEVKNQKDRDVITTELAPATEKGDSVNAKTAMANLWFDLLGAESSFRPYIGGGAGVAGVRFRKASFDGEALGSDDDTIGAWQAGAGLGFALTPKLVLSLDYRYLRGFKRAEYDFDRGTAGSTKAHYQTDAALLGLRYSFGGEEAPAPAPVEPVAVVPALAICADTTDNDGDGQIDYPNDPGCAAADDGDETDPAVCSDGKDNDGDGLIDFPSDKGCSAADDGDETDPCKTPGVGEKISLKGCGTGDVIVLRGVNFDFDKSSLTANARTLLDDVAAELTAYPDIKVELSGHTDAKGTDDYNQALSDRRAKAVLKYLKAQGIAADRMTALGYGQSKPVADNETDEGRELNRRVELKVLEGSAGVTVETAAPAPTASEPAAADAPAADADAGPAP